MARYCPVCKRELFRVYFGTETVWWRCMDCNIVFNFHEYRYEDGHLTKVCVWRREKCDAAAGK